MSKKTKYVSRKDYWAKYRQEIKAMQFNEQKSAPEKEVPLTEKPKKEPDVLLTSKKRHTHELIEEYEKTHRKNKEVIDEKEFRAIKIIASILLLALVAFIVFYVIKEKF